MDIRIYHLIEGAKEAEGLTVIIDVLRAFTLECYLYDMGAKCTRPIGSISDAFQLKEKYPDAVLSGERNGKKVEGFDFGNTPSGIKKEDVFGKMVLHTTSAGTQGIVNATHASEIITGAFVNAKAVARYIKKKNPDVVSLVCMGNGGVREAKEDELCALYIKALLEGEEIPDFEKKLQNLQFDGGDHFFNPLTQDVYPEPDFWLSIKPDIFDFVIQVTKDSDGFVTRKVDVSV